MHLHARRQPCLSSGGIAAVLLCALCVWDARAGGYWYRDYYPYDAQEYHERQRLRQDMRRLREDMRRQHRRLEEQARLQQEQTRLLRQQQSAQQRIMAMQACYYRFDAGLELCEDLFDSASSEYAACSEKVVEKNPGCAGDLARPSFQGVRPLENRDYEIGSTH